MIKVLHIITRLEKGGSSKNVLYSAGKMKKIRSFLVYGKSAFQEDLSGLEKSDCFEIPELKRELSPLSDAKALISILKILNETRPDILHTHTSKAGALGRLAGFIHKFKNKNLAVVHTPHGHLLYGYFGPVKTFLFKFAEMLLSRITDHFIALTEGEKLETARAGIGQEAEWEVIHSGIDFPAQVPSGELLREKLGLKKDDFLIGAAGRLEKVKGMETFIRGAAEFEKKTQPKDARYLLVGDGSLRGRLEELAADLGLKEKTIFAGFREPVYEYLSAMDLYVQPSLNEAMGRTVLEAMFCGLPVIVSDACGLPYVIKENGNGLIFRRGDHKDLAEKLALLYSQPSKLAEFSAVSRKRVSAKDEDGLPEFSAEAMKRKLEIFYARITQGGVKTTARGAE